MQKEYLILPERFAEGNMQKSDTFQRKSSQLFYVTEVICTAWDLKIQKPPEAHLVYIQKSMVPTYNEQINISNTN